MIERRAARVVLVAERSVLLLEGVDPARPEAGSWWVTPGGGIVEGETVEAAAVREVHEETGLRLGLDDLGPVVASRTATFEFDGRRIRQTSSFFAVRVALFTPGTSGWGEVERRSLQGHRWWPVDELRATDERVYPRELPDLVDAVLQGDAHGRVRKQV